MASTPTLRTGWFSRRSTPYIALALSLLFTFLVTAYLLWSAAVRDRARFERRAQEIGANIKNLVSTYIALLQAGEGFVAANEGELSRKKFGEFVGALDLDENYPGVQGIGYTKRFPNRNVEAYEQAVREQGVTGFHIWPRGDEPTTHAIVFLEPLDRRNLAAIGYNMHSEPVRRMAMDLARDTGWATVSGRVTLVQEIDKNKQRGFLIYNPVYSSAPSNLAERREKLLGFVYSPFRADDFFNQAGEEDLLEQVDFAVYAGDEPRPSALLHDSRAFNAPLSAGYQPRFTTQLTERMPGSDWTLVFRSRPGFDESLSSSYVWGGFTVGVVFSILIFLIARSQSRGWQKAELGAERLARSQLELEASEARLREHVAELQQAEARILAAAERSQILAEASSASAAAALDKRAVAKVATDAVYKHLGDLSVIALKTEDGDSVELAAYSFGPSEQASPLLSFIRLGAVPIKGAVFEKVILERQTIFMPQVDVEQLKQLIPEEQHRLFEIVTLHSAMAVPLLVQGRVVGAIGAARYQDSPPYSEEDFFILNELASRVALAVENASLYERAQNAIRLRDEFLSIASHELKTPLTPLQLQVQSLQRLLMRSGSEPLDPVRLGRIAEVTQRQIERITKLVNNLLDISRISAGKLAFEPEECDLAAITHDVLERFQIESERLQAPIELHAPAPVFGYWDRMRLEQVVTNLVSNSLKYGNGKPVDISVTLSDGQAELVVRDQGTGLSAEIGERVFERFFRGVSGREISGLGLGLYIVKQIVDGHGGTISVESEPGKGTRFFVRLPVRPSFGQTGGF